MGCGGGGGCVDIAKFSSVLRARPHRYEDQDRQWQDWAIPFCEANGFGVFYFALNPDAHQTGGILGNDWTTKMRDKLSLLRRLPASTLGNLPPMPPPSARFSRSRSAA